jgi:hypothetical protein
LATKDTALIECERHQVAAFDANGTCGKMQNFTPTPTFTNTQSAAARPDDDVHEQPMP